MSKLTLHFQLIPGFAQEFVASSGVTYVKLIDPPETSPFPGTRVIGRTYMPDGEANALIADGGVSGAEKWFARWLPIYESRDYVYAWESPNEPHPMSDASFRYELKEFLIRWNDLMHGRGWKTVGGNFSVGWPNIDTAKDVGAGIQECDFMGVHEYSAPAMWDNQTWLCLRYRRTVAELEAAGYVVPPVLITECGIDGGVIDSAHARTGWKSYATEDQYLQQLAWYDGELMADSYVEAATIFVAGPNSDWLDFEVTQSLAGKLANYIVNTPNPEPPVDDKAKGIDVSMFQGDINWPLVRADGYVFAMIRASGPNADRTKMIADPKFPANYAGAGSEGMLRAAYHGLHPDFAEQALLFVSTVGDRELELGYFADLENKALTDYKCQMHLESVDKRLIRRFGWTTAKYDKIYTSPSFMEGRTTTWAEGRDLWLAHWTSEDKIIIPDPWTEWEFWQHGVGDAGYVPGIDTRIDLDKYNGSEKELFDKYKPDSGGTGMMEVVDLNGNPIENGWAEAVARGARVIGAEIPEGATGWRASKLILDDGGSMAFRVYSRDENGAPISGIVMLEGWRDGQLLPADAAPRLSETQWGQPEGLPNKALILPDQFSDVDGKLEWTWGPGEFIDPANPAHWVWVMPGNDKWYSDVVFVPGWWDEHIKYWVVFVKVVGDDEPTPPVDGDLEEVVVELRRMADVLEYMKEHWPYK